MTHVMECEVQKVKEDTRLYKFVVATTGQDCYFAYAMLDPFNVFFHKDLLAYLAKEIHIREDSLFCLGGGDIWDMDEEVRLTGESQDFGPVEKHLLDPFIEGIKEKFRKKVVH